MSALKGKDILVIGARAGGYGDSIARAALAEGARVFGTSLTPDDPREQEYFLDLGAILIDVPLRFSADDRPAVLEDLARISNRLAEHGVQRLEAIIHTVAGGFPRQPSVMKEVGEILKGKKTFSDMATPVKKNVYYVNAGSFEDSVRGLSGLIDERTHLVALTYRGDLPYFIAATKDYLERLAARMARQGRRTLVAAFPEAWTQSSQFFAGIEMAVMGNYLAELRDPRGISPDVAEAFDRMRETLANLDGVNGVLEEARAFGEDKLAGFGASGDQGALSANVRVLFMRMRNEGSFKALRQSVEVISDFVREACARILIRDFIVGAKYQPGDVRQIHYKDLTGLTPIGPAAPRVRTDRPRLRSRQWATYEKDEIRRILSMYGENFLFLDRVVMEVGELHDGGMGFGSFTVPTPEQNPIMRDHFVGMPLFGGHLQMEMAAQFGTFMVLKALEGKKLLPILTGTEFPELDTMAPPGEKLSMMGVIRMHEKRLLTMEAFIENRYARSAGIIRGMILAERIVKKMMSSF